MMDDIKEAKDMILEMDKLFQDISLRNQEEKRHGRFFADKGYAFDTIYFCAKFILRFSDENNIYKKTELKETSNKYITDLFSLRQGAKQIKNYMTETIALLCFAKILSPLEKNSYKIEKKELLEFICKYFENAYIFEYVLTYKIFNNDKIENSNEKLWDCYKSFCDAKKVTIKQQRYDDYRKKYIDIDTRVKDKSATMADFVPKFPIIILNFINEQNMCSRTHTVQEKKVSADDISLNKNGTRAGTVHNLKIPKKNEYLKHFSKSYIIECLGERYLIKYNKPTKIENPTDSFYADLKLDMLDPNVDLDTNLPEGNNLETEDKKSDLSIPLYKIVGNKRVRTVQHIFRNLLLKNIPHKCPICGFSIEEFLVASHILPYSQCEDTYEAMDINNGYLMCPTCDKLFEAAKSNKEGSYITISTDGKIFKDKAHQDDPYFAKIPNKISEKISKKRKKYLDWHCREFIKHQQKE